MTCSSLYAARRARLYVLPAVRVIPGAMIPEWVRTGQNLAREPAFMLFEG